MGYNIQQKLIDNIAAIKIALQYRGGKVISGDELELLQRYSGFGGIKAVVFPRGDIKQWKESNASKQDMELHPLIMELHQVLQEHFKEKEYKLIIDSLKNSILSAFYTPPFVPKTLFDVLKSQDIAPVRLYEPSSGAGVFIREAAQTFPSLQHITAVEKDLMTGYVLKAVCNSLAIPSTIQLMGFEESSDRENGQFDLIASNIPFGNFRVHDPSIHDPALTGKIHNYFFAKGLDKIGDGGLLAFITTDAFLNNPSNKSIREYFFQRADFISLVVMPDNLMKETGNTEAANHLLVVQKNEKKNLLSKMEQQLIETTKQENEFGTYDLNFYIDEHPEIFAADTIRAGHNQYGEAYQTVWQKATISDIAEKLKATLTGDFTERFNWEKFRYLQLQLKHSVSEQPSKKSLTFLATPEKKEQTDSVQLGLFDTAPVDSINRAMDYLTAPDHTVIEKKSVRLIGTVKTNERPEHESVVLITAKARTNSNYYYKLFSNLEEIECSGKWVTAEHLKEELDSLQTRLIEYSSGFRMVGDNKFGFGSDAQSHVEIFFTDLKPHYKEGTLVFFNDQPGTIHHIDIDNNQSNFQPFSLQVRTAGFYKDYIGLRDCYFELAAKEEITGEAHESLREDLNGRYDRFIIHHGILNQPSNKKVLLNDALGFVTLSSLERKEDDQYVRSDLFYKPLFKDNTIFKTDDPSEALARCLNEKGQVDIAFIASTIDQSEEHTVHLLGDHIYLNPSNGTWETADKYLSGNVVIKLQQARKANEEDSNHLHIARSLEAIKKVQPEPIPFELLDFNLGERWMPLKYYNRFARELFDQEVNVYYLGSLDSFKVNLEKDNAKVNSEFAVTGKDRRIVKGNLILEHALENTTPFITYEIQVDNQKVRVADNEAIQLAHQKIETIRSKYNDWLRDLPAEDKANIEQVYNEMFNCYVLREYNGTHLQFPGLDKYALDIVDLYNSQKNAAWRIIQQRGGLIDHEVGLGKTLTMIVASYEMKRLGIVHKPLIIGIKTNTREIANTYRKAYPHARLLAPSDDDFTVSNRKRLFHSIKNNNWDCIILTHDQFGKIPQSPEIQQKILQVELDNLESDMDTMKEEGGQVSRAILKGLEVRKTNLISKLKEVVQRIEDKKDTDLSFEEMGIDHLFVDEAHKFKNLTFTTRHNRVAGLGNTEGSQRALNMLFAIRTLQDRFGSDLNATFLTGTPISNSLTELYLIFKYLRPREMERQQIENFDAWAAVYAKKSVDFEFSVTNEIIAKERFRHFIKVPELALFYNEITDYKTAAHIKLDKPEIEEILINLPPSTEQETFIKNLISFAKSGDGTLIGRGKLTPEEDKGRMLIATNYAKKMAVDMRLIDADQYSDDIGNKINTSARYVAEIYHESTPHLGTQIVFCDIGTPKPDQFNVYDDLKYKLVTLHGVKANEIAFIHDWENKKQELFKLMNAGRIRVLLGSTEKAGMGVNVQERVVASHDLDIPWTPKDLEQRNGRGARQGNKIAKQFYGNKVKNFIYATERSLDNYKFNLLKNKITFISQMKNGELHLRTIDEGAFDKQGGMNFSEYVAILSGDSSLLEKAKVEKRVAALESLRVIHYKQQRENKYKLGNLQADKNTLTETVAKISKDEQLYKSRLTYAKDDSKHNPIQLDDCQSSDPAIIGKFLIDLFKEWLPSNAQSISQKIGTEYGFDLYIERSNKNFINVDGNMVAYENKLYAQNGPDGIKYTYNNGMPTLDNPALAARYFLNAIDRVIKLKEQYQKQLDEVIKDIAVMEKMDSSPFDKEEELRQLKIELGRLESEIAAKIKAGQDQPAPDSEDPKEAPVIEMLNGKKKLPEETSLKRAS